MGDLVSGGLISLLRILSTITAVMYKTKNKQQALPINLIGSGFLLISLKFRFHFTSLIGGGEKAVWREVPWHIQ